MIAPDTQHQRVEMQSRRLEAEKTLVDQESLMLMLSSAEASSGIKHQALQTLILLRGAATRIELKRWAEPFHPCVR